MSWWGKILHCNCGLPPENHYWNEARGIPIGFGPSYANEGNHHLIVSMKFYDPSYPWGHRPHKHTRRMIPLLKENGTFASTLPQSIERAHDFCNKTCALFTLAPPPKKESTHVYIYERLYAAWFHHTRSDTRRGQFLVERLECSAMEELSDVRRPDDLELQTELTVKALLPIHAKICQAVEQVLANVPATAYIVPGEDEDLDEAAAMEPDGNISDLEHDHFRHSDEDQIGRVYTARDASDAASSIRTSTEYHLGRPEEFPFKPSFKEYFLVHDEDDFRSKGITLVRLGRPPLDGNGKKWKFDETMQVAWWRDDMGVILGRFLELTGLPPTDFPDIMHGRISDNEINPALGFRVEKVK